MIQTDNKTPDIMSSKKYTQLIEPAQLDSFYEFKLSESYFEYDEDAREHVALVLTDGKKEVTIIIKDGLITDTPQ